MIRSMEINDHIVDHPKFEDLDDHSTFDSKYSSSKFGAEEN